MRKLLPYLGCTLITLAILLNGCGSMLSSGADQSVEAENPAAQEALAAAPVYKRTEIISLPNEAKQLLIEGNQRFTSGKPLSKDLSLTRRSELMKNGQHPFAVIVSCSDSRVPPELLFDQALGDLFVIRVAGNIITPVELGSVEYAVEHLKTPLVVVLGHEECGAVTATVQGGETHGNIESIIKKIRPAVVEAKSLSTSQTTEKEVINKSIELNIKNAIGDIMESPIILEGTAVNQVEIIGIKYDLDEGVVRFIN
ncbi:carbonic anhydrase [Desulfosporosinus sp.]|uniref:carbonic anhydrase n=1 Tax=Desulfosporosinus sp. TaxID=157907 RepID=UPI0025C15932|nr:carbonic anhydrase [Desulfosporosinus sp.]MBC2724575.1 carbonic anhydrase [Desulfosporosinus sp.]MBC2725461.1 carbonic anhydrase [Desulfosporosinus sp.]